MADNQHMQLSVAHSKGPSPHHLQYHDEKYSLEDLRAFIKRRTAVDPEGDQTREYYVIRLRELDRNATFRLVDLPTELRLHVYGELLSYKGDQDGTLWPAILATTKVIHKEAMDVWKGTVAEKNGTGVITFQPGEGPVIYQLGTLVRQVVRLEREDSFPDMLDQIPVLPTAIKMLTIRFDTSQSGWDLTNYLYVLMASVCSSNIKSIQIEYDGKEVKSSTYFNWGLTQILWPLVLREKDVNLVLRGISSEIVVDMRADRERALKRSRKHELLRYQRTRTELKKIRCMVEGAGLQADEHFELDEMKGWHMGENVLVDDEINQAISGCANEAEAMLASRELQDLHQQALTRFELLRKEIADWKWPVRSV